MSYFSKEKATAGRRQQCQAVPGEAINPGGTGSHESEQKSLRLRGKGEQQNEKKLSSVEPKADKKTPLITQDSEEGKDRLKKEERMQWEAAAL